MVDYSLTSAEMWTAFAQCLTAFGFGFIVGMKLKLIRKIEEMA